MQGCRAGSLMFKHLPAGAFDPETVGILAGAFENACKTVEAGGTPAVSSNYASEAHEILAAAIISRRPMASVIAAS